MKIGEMRLVRVRCFEDTGNIRFAANCNIFVGKNNSGKSSLLKALLTFQGFPFDHNDIRPSDASLPSYVTIKLEQIETSDVIHYGRDPERNELRLLMYLRGQNSEPYGHPLVQVNPGQPAFPTHRPYHNIVPFLARRKATKFAHDVSLGAQSQVSGTLESLYSRIDSLATYGHPDHDKFRDAVARIVGIPITMKASSQGKEAGFYFDRDNFVTLERMGDGVSEMVALIVELCTEQKKIFVLEEPETNLHPSGLKALLGLVRHASENNQFFIATHSNVVVRELGGMDGGKVFRVFRDGDAPANASKVEEVEKTPFAHITLLRELGYDFADFELFEGWLFLEEASAETIFRDVLIPMFTPELRGRLRSYSSGGATNLEPSVSEFRRLIVFVHLEPVYAKRLWVRADGDDTGVKAILDLRQAFPGFTENALKTFRKSDFELYYPHKFQASIQDVLVDTNKQSRRRRKYELLRDVLAWSKANWDEARSAWEASAIEPIELLKSIKVELEKI